MGKIRVQQEDTFSEIYITATDPSEWTESKTAAQAARQEEQARIRRKNSRRNRGKKHGIREKGSGH